MKRTYYITSLCLIITLFISCGSDDDSSTKESLVGQIRVKAINENNINSYDLVYNQDGRIANIDVSGNQNSNIIYMYNAQNQPIQKGSTTYEYNAQGTVSKIITPSYTSEITYNQKGEIVLEESVENTYNIDRTFKYNNSGQLIEIAEHFISNNSGLAPYTKYFISHNSNNNISEILIRISNDDMVYTDRFEIKFGYDDKKSPLLNLQQNIGSNQGISDYMGILSFYTNSLTNLPPSLYFYGKNNILFYTRTDLNNNQQYKATYQHQYNEDGYPEITTITRINTNSQNSTELIYEWTYEKI